MQLNLRICEVGWLTEEDAEEKHGRILSEQQNLSVQLNLSVQQNLHICEEEEAEMKEKQKRSMKGFCQG